MGAGGHTNRTKKQGKGGQSGQSFIIVLGVIIRGRAVRAVYGAGTVLETFISIAEKQILLCMHDQTAALSTMCANARCRSKSWIDSDSSGEKKRIRPRRQSNSASI